MVEPGNNPANSNNLKASYVVVFLAASVLYVVSCAPGPLWQDSGMYQYRIWQHDIEGKLGLALSHPLYHIIGIAIKYIPLGEFAHRVNLVSAVAAAFAIANLFLLLRLWLGKSLPAIIAAVTLALSWTLWRFASIAEVYTLYLALLTAELIMLLEYIKTGRIKFLYLLGLLNGLAIADHMWAVIATACYIVFLVFLLARKQIRFKHLGVIFALWIIGSAPYAYLIIKNLIETGEFTATLASALFGSNWQGDVLNTSLSARVVKENLAFMAYNFPTPNVLFFLAGLYGLRKTSPARSFAIILLALLVLFFVFAFRYTVPDRYAFFLPFYCLVAVLVGVGFDLIITWFNRKILVYPVFLCALLPILAYIIVPFVAEKKQFKLPTRTIAYRQEYTWFLQPWKTGYQGAERFASEVLNSVEDDAVIIADGTTVCPIWYLQKVKQTRPEVKVLSALRNYKNPIEFPTADTIADLMAERSVYVVSPLAGYCPGYLLEHYNFIKIGPIYKVVERQ